jgi:hypothetical protein
VTITAVREGVRQDADDTETLTIQQNGHILTVTGAPPERNRISRGILEVMRRSVLTADVKGAWEDLRAWAAEFGLLVDSRDDVPKGASRDDRYQGLAASGLMPLSPTR